MGTVRGFSPRIFSIEKQSSVEEDSPRTVGCTGDSLLCLRGIGLG